MDGVILNEEKKREQMESYLLQTSKTQITHAKQQSQLY
jgi:hypothetical protein